MKTLTIFAIVALAALGCNRPSGAPVPADVQPDSSVAAQAPELKPVRVAVVWDCIEGSLDAAHAMNSMEFAADSCERRAFCIECVRGGVVYKYPPSLCMATTTVWR